MAEGGGGPEDPQLSFPLPPAVYYRKYTDARVKSNSVPKPPKVVEGDYTMFGHCFKTDDEIIQPLESQGIKRLYSKEKNFDRISEMKKLNHSILVNYLALLDIMIEAPSSPERQKKIEEIKVLFINLHHLINEFRPHQARETLRVMLHRQKQQRLETADRLRRIRNRFVDVTKYDVIKALSSRGDFNIEKARAILKSCGRNLSELAMASSTATNEISEEKRKENLTPEQMKDELLNLQHNLMCDIVDKIS